MPDSQKMSAFTEQTSSNISASADYLAGYTTTGGNQNRRFSLGNLGGFLLTNFNLTLGGESTNVKAAIDSLATTASSLESDMDSLEARIDTTDRAVEWLEMVNDMRIGNHSKYAIGDIITEPWTDIAANRSYDNPWRVNHFETVESEGGVNIPGMWLQNKYAHPFGVQFSHPRAFLRCPEGLAAGSYYFTFGAKDGDYVLKDDIVAFTIADDLGVGARLDITGLSAAKSTWAIHVYDATGKTITETITPVFEIPSGATDLGTMNINSRNGDLNSIQEVRYGWNRWKTSAIRQYLNSDAGVGLWWTAQDGWDIAPDQLTTKAGYLTGLPEAMKELLVPVKYTTYTNTVNDGGNADVTYDKVGLISLEQMYVNPQIAGEGEAHEYWEALNGTETKWAQSGTYPELIQYAVENHSSAQYVRLRSAYRGNAGNTWYVYSSGYVSYYATAHTAIRFEPLVFIG